MSRFAEPFVHVDMDAFYTEVERLRHPELVGRPVIVGGLGRRGVVASASYEAREQGVSSAMPMGRARRLSPGGHFLPSDHNRYRAVSSEVLAVLRRFTPTIEVLSIDEAFLDVSGLRLHYTDPAAVGRAIRATVRSEVGIPSSVGAAATKFIAKMASAAAKPDGLLVVPAGSEREFLEPMAIESLWGVGPATRAGLRDLGVRTIGDLARTPASVLTARLGGAHGEQLAALARGEDARSVATGTVAKSISVEETYPEDLTSGEAVERELLRLCDRLSDRIRRSESAGRTVTLKLRYDDFETLTRSVTTNEPIATTTELWEAAASLLVRSRSKGRPVRLLGVGLSSLVGVSEPLQMSMTSPRPREASRAVEDVRRRFGDEAIVRARLLGTPEGSPGAGEPSEGRNTP